ncbi:phosphoribosyltransferase [Achromobacter xylosoxidans]
MSAPTSDDSHLWVTWDDYNRLIERLALQVHQSGWEFDKILCLARGGMRVGDVMSRIFDVPLGILATSSYREAAGTKQGDMDIAQFITITRGTLSGRVLLVDDMVDTGKTFMKVYDHLKSQFADITELRSAVLWWKGHSQAQPDYYVDKLPTNPWIHQPFEDYDSLRPHQLEAWILKGSKG